MVYLYCCKPARISPIGRWTMTMHCTVCLQKPYVDSPFLLSYWSAKPWVKIKAASWYPVLFIQYINFKALYLGKMFFFHYLYSLSSFFYGYVVNSNSYIAGMTRFCINCKFNVLSFSLKFVYTCCVLFMYAKNDLSPRVNVYTVIKTIGLREHMQLSLWLTSIVHCCKTWFKVF